MDNYQRKQDVKKVYRKQNGEYTLVDCVYTEDWDMPKRRAVAKDISGQKSGLFHFWEQFIYDLFCVRKLKKEK